MALIVPSSSGVTQIASGTWPGVWFYQYHDVVLQGEGYATVLQADGSNSSDAVTMFPTPPQTPDVKPVSRAVYRNLCLDANGHKYCVTAPLAAGPRELVFQNCLFKGYTDFAVVAAGCRVVFENCEFWAKNAVTAVEISSGGRASFFNCRNYGGSLFIIAADGYRTPAPLVIGCKGQLDYWATPANHSTYADSVDDDSIALHVATSTALTQRDVVRYLTRKATGVTISASTTTLTLTGLGWTPGRWDRLVGGSGEWTQVLDVDDTYAYLDTWRASGKWDVTTPPASATAYSVTLANVYQGTTSSFEIQMPDSLSGGSGWRTVDGDPAVTPVASANDVVEMVQLLATGYKDVGWLHFTSDSESGVISGCHCRGGNSDMITVRGEGHTVTGCVVERGQDMGYTVDGNHVLVGCKAVHSGVSGFAVISGVPQLSGCDVRLSGIVLNGNKDIRVTSGGVILDGHEYHVTESGDLYRVDISSPDSRRITFQ